MSENTPPDEFDPHAAIADAWASQDNTESPDADGLSFDPAELLKSVNQAQRKDQRRLLWLNIREVVPGIVVAVVFASGASEAVHPAVVLASIVPILLVMAFLVINSVRMHQADRAWGSTVRDQLRRRISQLERRAWFLRNVWWWYLAPFLVAILLYTYGQNGSFTSMGLAPWVVIAAILVGGYGINLVAARKYESQRDEVTPLLEEFDRKITRSSNNSGSSKNSAPSDSSTQPTATSESNPDPDELTDET